MTDLTIESARQLEGRELAEALALLVFKNDAEIVSAVMSKGLWPMTLTNDLAVSLFEPGMPLEGSVVTCPDGVYEDDWIVSIGEMEVRGTTFAFAVARAALVREVIGERDAARGRD